ncbi:hypothetical protein TNCV_807011 [Trichonephila clavipes]|nr:hypothetical protein TNCV_807011 [Trichonephila clavipes]
MTSANSLQSTDLYIALLDSTFLSTGLQPPSFLVTRVRKISSTSHHHQHMWLNCPLRKIQPLLLDLRQGEARRFQFHLQEHVCGKGDITENRHSPNQ